MVNVKKPMIYLGHPIRGKMKTYGGDDANVYNHENVNCLQAIDNVLWLRENYPQVRWYCPGEVETPIQMAHRMNFLSVPQILDMDFAIIRLECSGGLLHIWEDSKGAEKEAVRCEGWSYPYHVFREVPKEIWDCDQRPVVELVKSVLFQYEALDAVRPSLQEVIEELSKVGD
jgi:hypothetical protein